MKGKKAGAGEKLAFHDILTGAMLAAIVGAMPLIVRMAVRPMPPELVDMMGKSSYIDLFVHWKGVFLAVPVGIIGIHALSAVATSGELPDFRKLLMRPPVYFSAAYLLLVLLSALFSDYAFTSWRGTWERGEGALMWLAYFAAFFAAMLYVRQTRHAWFVLWGLAFSALVMGLVGIGQMFGHDFFATDLADRLILFGTGHAPDEVGGFTPTFSNMANSTLYNPNTFGKYAAMAGPLLLLTAVFYRGRALARAALFASGLAMLLGIVASSSLGGAAGAAAVVFVLLLVFFWRLLGGRTEIGAMRAPALAGAALLAVFAGAVAAVPAMRGQLADTFERFARSLYAPAPLSVYDFTFGQTTMRVAREGLPVMTLEWPEHGTVLVFDGDGNEVAHAGRTQMDGHFRLAFDVPGYRRVVAEIHPTGADGSVLGLHLGGADPLYLANDGERLLGFGAGDRAFDIREGVPAWGFRGHENFGSNRGYIWSRSLPLLPRTALLGTGPDTFVNTFPQHDAIGKLRFYGTPYILVDKAHNIFLQTWISTGGLSALALFGLFGHFLFVNAAELARAKKMPGQLFGLRLGILCAVSAFVVSGMATDSTVGSTGVFFVILGAGYGLRTAQTAEAGAPARPA